MTNNPKVEEVRAALLATAASIGSVQRDALQRAENNAKATQRKVREWQDKDADAQKAADDGNSGGFTTLRFQGMSMLGKAFGESSVMAVSGSNDPNSDVTKAIAESMVKSFMETFTGATSKTDKGGTAAGIARFVTTGTAAPSILAALQGRIEHWQKIRDSANESDNPADAQDAKAAKALADRYLKLADSPKINKDTGKTKPAKWLGRMGVTVRGITIGVPGERKGGTNRTAQIAEIAGLYHQHGDAVLHPDVLDAFLDNGGPADKEVAGVEEWAAKAADAIDRLLHEFGGENTADGLNLTIILPVLKRISKHGFAPAVHAPLPSTGTASYVVRANDPEPPAEAVVQSQQDATAVLGIPDDEQRDTPPPLPTAPVEDVLALPEASDDEPEITEEMPTGAASTPPPLPTEPAKPAARKDNKAPRTQRVAPPPRPARAQRAGL